MGDILVAEGDVAKVGQQIAVLLAGASGGAIAPSKGSAGDEGGGVGVVASVNEPTAMSKDPMPSASRIIKENGLDAGSIAGTGKDGRITKGDALSAKANPAPVATAPAPAAPSAPRDLGPREERVRMSRLRQTIARRLKDAQNTAAMLTTYNEADMSAVMAMRSQYKETFLKKHGIKLGFMSFFVKACVQALKDVPSVNAEIDGTDIIFKNFYDISIAVGTPKGLVVPVLRGCDELSLGGIEKGISALGAKARDGQLSMADMSGGTFTISNGGVYGSLMSSPILNPPQSGILGMHKIEKRPIVVNDEIVIRPMMYLALSYDHRIVDGKEAVTFLVRVKECLEDPERLLLDL
jgi:2-oxoglutarate dehydrogenase E2 component (dihydrolipoamide succinyltransferase)